jgi:hypothetical protein
VKYFVKSGTAASEVTANGHTYFVTKIDLFFDPEELIEVNTVSAVLKFRKCGLTLEFLYDDVLAVN